MSKHLKTVKGSQTSYKNYTNSLNVAKTSTIGMTLAQGALKVAASLANAALTMGISLIVTGAIEGISYLREKFFPTADEVIEKANALRSEFESSTTTIGNQLNSLKALQPEYIKLSKGVSEYGENVSLTADEYERYKNIVAEILGYTPTLTTGFNNEGKAIANKNGLLEKSIALLEEENRQKMLGFTTDDALWVSARKNVEEYKQKLDKIKEIKVPQTINYSAKKIGEDGSYVNIIEDYIQDVIGEEKSEWENLTEYIVRNQEEIYYNLDKIQERASQTKDGWVGLNKEQIVDLTSYFQEIKIAINDAQQAEKSFNPTLQLVPQTLTSYQEMSNAQKNFISQYINGFKITANTTEQEVAKMSQSIKLFVDDISNNREVQEAINNLFDLNKNTLSASNYQEQANAIINSIATTLNLSDTQKLQLKIGLGIEDKTYAELINKVKEKLKDEFGDRVGELTFPELEFAYSLDNVGKMTIDELKAKFAETTNEAKSLSSALSFEEVNKQIDNLQSAYQTLSTVVSDYSTNQYLTIDNLQSLLALGNDYLQYLSLENGQLKFNEGSMLALANARIDDAEATYLQESTTLMKKFSDDKIAADYLKDSLKDLAGARLVEAEAAYKQAMADALASGGDYADAAKKLNGVVENGRKIFDVTRNSLGKYTSAVMGAGTATKKATEDISQAMSKAQSAINSLLKMTMDMIKQNYNNQKEDLEKLKDAEKDRYDVAKEALDKQYEKQKKNYDLQKQTIEDAINAAKSNLDLRLKALQAEKDAYYWNKELSKQTKSVSDLEADIATIANDKSDEGIAKKRELEALLAEEKEKLADMQFDHEKELQEEALNNEYDLFEEKQNNKLDKLDKQNQRREEIHQAELDRLESEYNAYIDQQDAKIKAIDDYTKYEVNIRNEAIKMIEDKNSGLYQKLIEWNRQYGDGLDSTIVNGWNNAQSAMNNFNGAQLGVLGVLNDLALKMNAFDSSIKNAANSARDLSSALNSANAVKDQRKKELLENLKSARDSLERAKRAQAGLSVYQDIEKQIKYIEQELSKYHTGGVVRKNGNQNTTYPNLRSDEVVIKAKVGETILSHDYPDRAKMLMADFINSDKFLTNNFDSNLFKTQNSVSYNTRFSNGTLLSKYERSNMENNIDIKQGDIIIQGNADKSTVMDIKKITEYVTSEIVRQIHRSGFGNLKVL